ncbi:MAG: hypothetical protein HY216_00975 [Candidatus Rokubacteria bacterium]|nr:hypothetical protein [Candidatus Rokubacteria bacterium]
MSRRRSGHVRIELLGAVLLAAACGSPAPLPAPVQQRSATAPASPTQQLAETSQALSPALEIDAPKYDAKGRRDPFVVIGTREGAVSPVTAARLTGIVKGGGAPLALVETPDGLGYILKTGDTLGDGRLVEIGPNLVVFTVAAKPGVPSNRVVLRLAID